MSRRAVLAALVLSWVVAGCGGDPEPKIAAPTPSVSSTSAAPTESATPEAGTPEQYVASWAAAEVAMQNTGDTEQYRQLTKKCASCLRLADQVAGYYAAGGYVKFDGQRVERITRRTADGPNLVVVATLKAGPTEYAERSGGPIERYPGGPIRYKMTLQQDQDAWTLLEYTRLA